MSQEEQKLRVTVIRKPDSYVIIAKTADLSEYEKGNGDSVRVGVGEAAVEVPMGLLVEALVRINTK